MKKTSCFTGPASIIRVLWSCRSEPRRTDVFRALRRHWPTQKCLRTGAPVSPTVQMLEKLLLETCVPPGYRRDVERHRQRSTLFRWGWQESPRADRFISPG